MSATAAIAQPFPDHTIRAGIKHAIAGFLAFYWALSLQLPSPSWAVVTVIMLMIADYVGAIAEKSFLRAVGTVAGAALGVWLAGDYINDPVLLLSICFVCTAIGVTMFGGTWFPYAFFLGAVTMSIVIVDSLHSLVPVWMIGMNRVLEISLGIVATVVVSSLIWPRYARVDFRREFSAAMRTAKRLVVGGGPSGTCQPFGDEDRRRIQTTFMQHINKLRNLLHFGSRESRFFAVRADSFGKLTFELSLLFESAIGIGHDKCFRHSYGPLLGAPLEELHAAVAEEFDALSDVSPEIGPPGTRLADAIAACDTRLRELAEQRATRDIDFAEVLEFSVYYNAVLEISRRLGAIREILHSLPSASAFPRKRRPAALRPSSDDLRLGIKTSLSVIISLVLVDWLQPPGAAAIPPAAFLFTALPKLNPTSGGDVGAFGRVLKIGLAGVILIPLLLAIAPLLADPVWLGLFLTAGMFVFGLWSARIGGMSGWSIVYLLFFCGVLGLNAQQPVPFQTVFGMVAGTVIGIGIASFVQRFVWPILPHVMLMRSFAEFHAKCADFLRTDEDTAKTEAAVALFAASMAEKIQGARHILKPADAARLLELAAWSQRIGLCLMRCKTHRTLTQPGAIGEFAAPLAAECDRRFVEALRSLERYFREGEMRLPADPASPAAEKLEEAVAGWRRDYLNQRHAMSHEHVLLIATTAANSTAARLLDQALRDAAAIPIGRYTSDSYL